MTSNKPGEAVGDDHNVDSFTVSHDTKANNSMVVNNFPVLKTQLQRLGENFGIKKANNYHYLITELIKGYLVEIRADESRISISTSKNIFISSNFEKQDTKIVFKYDGESLLRITRTDTNPNNHKRKVSAYNTKIRAKRDVGFIETNEDNNKMTLYNMENKPIYILKGGYKLQDATGLTSCLCCCCALLSGQTSEEYAANLWKMNRIKITRLEDDTKFELGTVHLEENHKSRTIAFRLHLKEFLSESDKVLVLAALANEARYYYSEDESSQSKS